ncbi:tetratricopeptide repeat protein, partial [Methanosarcina mazei]
MKPVPEYLSTQLNNIILVDGSILSEKVDEQYKLDLLADPKNAVLHASYGYFLEVMGQLEKAAEELKSSLDLDPRRIATRINYGRLLYRLGYPEEAENEFKIALEMDPKNAATHTNYGFLLQETNRLEEAEREYKLAFLADPSDLTAYVNYGTLLDKMNRLEDAEEQYKKALEIDPQNPVIHSNYGVILYKMDRVNEAEQQHKLALMSNPKCAAIHYNYGIFLDSLGRLEEAEKEFKIALENDPKNPNYNYRGLHFKVANHSKFQSAIHYDYGFMLDKMSRPKEAENEFKTALENDPQNSDLHYYYGQFLYENDRKEEAEREYKLALVFDSKNLAAHSSYAILLDKMGMLEEAEEHYNIALEIDPQNSINHNNYGYLLDRTGRIEQTEKHYKVALNIDPQNFTTRANYVNFLYTRNRFEEAEKHYKILLANDSKNRELNYNYAHILYDMDRLKEAAKHCKKFLKYDPNYADIRFLYSLTILHLPRFSDRKVKTEMEKAARLFAESGNNFHEHITRAIIYDALANKYYQWAQKYNIEETNSKCWKYTDVSGDEYIEAGKQSGEGPKGELLTLGYIKKGKARVRKIVLYTIYPNNSSDSENFKKIINGIQEAAEFYKKAAEASTEENKDCNACFVSMSVFADMLDCMRAIIEKRTFTDLDNKVPIWKNKLSYSHEVYMGNNKGELFVDSLYKAIDCMQNLKKYKEEAMFLDGKAVEKCIMELIEVANNIEGPLQKILYSSAEQMDIHREQIKTWDGTITQHFTLPESEPSGFKKFKNTIVNILKLSIKSVYFWIVSIL